MSRSFRFVGCSTFLATLLFTGCSDTTSPMTHASVQIVSGDAQSSGVGAILPKPITVKVVDASGHPLSGVPVEWRVVAGGGWVDSLQTRTASDGTATVQWTLGTDIG